MPAPTRSTMKEVQDRFQGRFQWERRPLGMDCGSRLEETERHGSTTWRSNGSPRIEVNHSRRICQEKDTGEKIVRNCRWPERWLAFGGWWSLVVVDGRVAVARVVSVARTFQHNQMDFNFTHTLTTCQRKLLSKGDDDLLRIAVRFNGSRPTKRDWRQKPTFSFVKEGLKTTEDIWNLLQVDLLPRRVET